MTRREHILLDAPWILTNRVITNQILKVVMIIVVLSIVVDLSLLKLYDLTPKNPYPRDRMLIFSCISAAFHRYPNFHNVLHQTAKFAIH